VLFSATEDDDECSEAAEPNAAAVVVVGLSTVA
jgi:hypothetical protein